MFAFKFFSNWVRWKPWAAEPMSRPDKLNSGPSPVAQTTCVVPSYKKIYMSLIYPN